MTKPKKWINVLPLQQWTSLYSPTGDVMETFKLASYTVINGSPKMEIVTKGQKLIETGLVEAAVSNGLTVRFYVPIELHNVPGIGLSPKVVYTLPKDCRIEEYKPPAYVSPEQEMYERARKHDIITLKR